MPEGVERTNSARAHRSRPARDMFANEESKIRYEAYSRLQAAAVAFGEALPIPEIVAIGGQSDGKSSLLEAFLGFRFNVREVEMGTRRPLVVQMVHDQLALEPRCRLQNEDDTEYGPVIVPETAVTDLISKRTEDHLKDIGATVSAKPICMRVEFAFCPNLTIIDTPGLILKAKKGQQDDCPDAILDMVKAFIAPPHRLVLFLQQSSVEWASSLWMHIIQEADPTFSRTVMIASKFDNRLREFKEDWEVNKYLSATGYLPPKVRPFFVSLPADRSASTSAGWRKQIHETDASTLAFLRTNIKGGFSEDTYASHIGFANLRRWLETELARRYRCAAPATLSTLQQRCDDLHSELATVQHRLTSVTDSAELRRSAMAYAGQVVTEVSALLSGTSTLDPALFGMTADEERAYLGPFVWPGLRGPIRPPNASLKLFGGAAFERCMHEFQKAADALEYPSVARDRVANVLLAHRGTSHVTNADQAAQQIATGMAQQMLLPLLDAACARLALMLRRVFDIAKLSMDTRAGGSSDSLRMFVHFHASLQTAYNKFITTLQETACQQIKRQLESTTSRFTLSTMLMRMEAMAQAPEQLALTLPGHVSLEADFDEDTPASHDRAGASPGSDGPAGTSKENGGAGASNSGAREGEHLSAIRTQPGTGAFIDGSPSKGRVAKAQRVVDPRTPMSANPLYERKRGDLYEDVVDKSSKLFAIIRQTVVCEAAPSALKSAFLDPLHNSLFNEVFLSLFACNDKQFMSMFHADGVVQELTSKADKLARRADGLTKCKDEFAQLARCL